MVELKCRVGELSVTIVGPAGQATQLLQRLVSESGGPVAASPRSETSFDLVSSVGETQAGGQEESRAEIEATFSPCPGVHLVAASKLSGSALSGQERIKRAWLAGQWARAVKEGRITTPNRSKQLDLRPRFYAVLSSPNTEGAVLCKSAGAYWQIVEDLATSCSISHGFPSEVEAKVYLASAGVDAFDTRQ